MISTLALEITNKGDCSFFRIKDSSYYNPNLPITCGHLVILPPTKTVPIEFEVEPYFDITLNTANLKMQSSATECLNSLPDGVYYIKYSINPNAKLYVEYYYLHNCNQYSKFIDSVCKTFANKCDFTKKEYQEKIEEIQYLKTLIDSSKYLVESCDNKEEGLRLYDEITYLLNKYKHDDTCKNCR